MKILNDADKTGLRYMAQAILPSVLMLSFSVPAEAQELELRRWSHLPVDRSFGTINFATTDGDISFDPVLQIQDASVSLNTLVFGYIRTFELLGHTARIELRQAWQEGTWDGLVDGEPVRTDREGMADTIVRFGVNLYGAPPLSGGAFADYRKAAQSETIIGAAFAIQLPTGEYMDDKLINLGTNRYTFRPQIGLQHEGGDWTYEVTGTGYYYTDNTSFLNGSRLEQKPYYALDGSVEYSFGTGVWVAANAGLGVGGETMVNGVSNDDRKRDIGWAISAGFPILDQVSLKVSYTDLDHLEAEGTASRTVSLGVIATW